MRKNVETNTRRKKRIKKRRPVVARPSLLSRAKQKSRRLFKFARLVGALVLLGWLGYCFLGDAGYLRCRKLEIDGLNRLDREEVVNSLPPILNKNLLLLPLGLIQRRAEELKLVERAAVSRVFPGRIRITIKEREPFAVAIIGEQSWAVDDQGGVLYPFNSRQLEDAAFITGLSPEDEDNGARINWAVCLIKRLNRYSESYDAVSEINVADPEKIKLYAFAKGLEIRLDYSCFQEDKWKYLVDFLAERSFAPEKLAYLDLRYKDIVVRPL